MNLPVINNLPIHSIHLEVLKKDVKFKPFTVSQEKGFLSAISDNNTKDIINNYLILAKNCIIDEIDFDKLTLIDFMLISINLRAKSQGESLHLRKKECEYCKEPFDFEINLEDSIEFDYAENLKHIVKIDDNLSIEIKPLPIDYLYNLDNLKSESDIAISSIVYSISKIFFNGEIYTNLKYKEIDDNCVSNLSRKQMKMILDEIKKLITLKLIFNIECPHCKKTERLEVTDFLEFLK